MRHLREFSASWAVYVLWLLLVGIAVEFPVTIKNFLLLSKVPWRTLMKFVSTAIFAALLFASGAATAGDVDAGKAKSAICASCHGPAGISPNPLWPNLAGQKEQYLIKQIKAFRDGTRQDPMMAPMVAALSDDDIANLAAYYASLK